MWNDYMTVFCTFLYFCHRLLQITLHCFWPFRVYFHFPATSTRNNKQLWRIVESHSQVVKCLYLGLEHADAAAGNSLKLYCIFVFICCFSQLLLMHILLIRNTPIHFRKESLGIGLIKCSWRCLPTVMLYSHPDPPHLTPGKDGREARSELS